MTDAVWVEGDDRPLQTIARNIATRYALVGVEMIIGLLTLPFNLHHLGPQAYGLLTLTAGITVHFSILDLGYGGAMVKFVAQYRAHRDARALNEVASTIFVIFSCFGVIAYLVVMALAFNIEHVFKLTPAQVTTGRWILLIVGLNVAVNFAFAVYGGICVGFQRLDRNNVVAVCSAVAVALANVIVLLLGYGLIGLVTATTSVRMATYLVYRHNAYRVFPMLRVSLALFRRDRLREVTGFSIYASMIDWANKLNYELDELVIGVFMGSAPVAIWAVADRVISGTQRLTNQGNAVLFPVVVDSDVTGRESRLQTLLLEGTRLSLATVIPVAVVLIVLADAFVRAWVGPAMAGAAPVIQILAFAVALRVGTATSTTLLKGAGQVRYLAFVNLTIGVVNLVLSALLIKPLGLIGVAIGTLVPIAAGSMFVIFPAACRRIDVPVARAFRQAVWPAVWPAAVVGFALFVSRRVTPAGLATVLVEAAAAALLYLALFVVALGPVDRAHYAARLRELAERKRKVAQLKTA
ncbi:MAG TPA: oligosaccharide flippase family protein [Vicinamibacterales bacterium]|nr:oligosaccharide flippase family protein [Vicinamibacterales bacterium]